jgi:hypothetical protein
VNPDTYYAGGGNDNPDAGIIPEKNDYLDIVYLYYLDIIYII